MEPGHFKQLYDNPGPFASVYLATDRADPEAAHAIELRWRELRGRLEADGADEPTLEAIDAAVGSDRGRPSPHGQAIFAAGGSVLLQEELPVPNVLDRAAFGHLPDVLPLLAQAPDFPSYLLVFADRGGAEVEVYDGAGVEERERVDAGARWPLRKVHNGDWHEAHFQREVENTWAANAKQEADRVRQIAQSHHAELIAVSGDARAKTMLLEHLGPDWSARAVPLPSGGRAEGSDRAQARRAAMVVAARTEESLRADVRERYAGRLATGGAVEGLVPTVEALRRGEVDTLLIRHGSKELDSWMWWGPQPGQLAAHPEELTDMRSAQIRRDKAGNVLVRAAVQSGSRILVLAGGEPGPQHGVGAVLRHT
jgi:hypothetical protein